jgi:hypothetical protein
MYHFEFVPFPSAAARSEAEETMRPKSLLGAFNDIDTTVLETAAASALRDPPSVNRPRG